MLFKIIFCYLTKYSKYPTLGERIKGWSFDTLRKMGRVLYDAFKIPETDFLSLEWITNKHCYLFERVQVQFLARVSARPGKQKNTEPGNVKTTVEASYGSGIKTDSVKLY